jgi:uncharacterized protein
MMPQAEALYYLQQIDLQILRNRKRLEEIAATLEDNTVVTAAREQVEAAQTVLAPLKTGVRNLELEIETNVQKTRSTEDRLYSGNVKNPKELQDMEQELAALKKRHGQLEDRLLEEMIAVEAAQEELDAREAELTNVTASWESQHSDLLNERAELEAKVERLHQQRETALKNVLPESLETYTQMRPKKANQPIAALRNGSCGVCGIEQTKAIEQEVQRGRSFVACLNCGRLLADVRD